jgi:hypothetical protein
MLRPDSRALLSSPPPLCDRVSCGRRVVSCPEPLPAHISVIMSGSPRISDKELAQINAAAVTKEYRVQPHLGTRSLARGYVQLPIALG